VATLSLLSLLIASVAAHLHCKKELRGGTG
jgi:hypothetical protein